ncbi:PmoA family protein [Maribacter algicola]|uniref:PmoA family protein n=1 Tax=Meishania litoralis TaxID=3434685 RepID=A0ACC7LFZ7_9FLAO
MTFYKIYRYTILAVLLLGCKEIKKDAEVENGTLDEAAIPQVEFVENADEQRMAIYLNGKLFTNYIYDGQTPKPILYPILTKSGKTLTRGFPYEPRPNERVDHPHHAGLWLNYGDVNGLDFWNNSYAIPDSEKHKYGSIFHQGILESDADKGILKIRAIWRSPDNVDLLEEITEFRFSEEENTRTIDRSTTLKALQDVSFKDNKEGMIGIRVAREMELPSDEPAIYTDAEGNITEVKALNNEGINGNYHGSGGLTGNDVWGTRNNWVKLESTIDGETVSITIMDHKDNVGYPTYWHARGYGLFAANPLGQAVFSEGKETLDFKLKKGGSTTFNYRILVHNGSELSKNILDHHFTDFNVQ